MRLCYVQGIMLKTFHISSHLIFTTFLWDIYFFPCYKWRNRFREYTSHLQVHTMYRWRNQGLSLYLAYDNALALNLYISLSLCFDYYLPIMQKLCFVLGVSDPSKHTHKNEKIIKRMLSARKRRNIFSGPLKALF